MLSASAVLIPPTVLTASQLMPFCVVLLVQEEEKNRGDRRSILTQHPTKITAATQNCHSTRVHQFS